MTAHILTSVSESLVCLQPWMREKHDLAADILSRQQSSIPRPPPGYPNFIDGPMNWSGHEADKMQLRVLELTASDVTEIGEGLQFFHSTFS